MKRDKKVKKVKKVVKKVMKKELGVKEVKKVKELGVRKMKGLGKLKHPDDNGVVGEEKSSLTIVSQQEEIYSSNRELASGKLTKLPLSHSNSPLGKLQSSESTSQSIVLTESSRGGRIQGDSLGSSPPLTPTLSQKEGSTGAMEGSTGAMEGLIEVKNMPQFKATISPVAKVDVGDDETLTQLSVVGDGGLEDGGTQRSLLHDTGASLDLTKRPLIVGPFSGEVMSAVPCGDNATLSTQVYDSREVSPEEVFSSKLYPIDNLPVSIKPVGTTEEPTAFSMTEEPTAFSMTEEPTAFSMTEEPTAFSMTEEPTAFSMTASHIQDDEDKDWNPEDHDDEPEFGTRRIK